MDRFVGNLSESSGLSDIATFGLDESSAVDEFVPLLSSTNDLLTRLNGKKKPRENTKLILHNQHILIVLFFNLHEIRKRTKAH